MSNHRTQRYYQLRWRILQRDGFTCQYCGQRAPDVILSVDHITSIRDGGSDEADNLITCCWACNIGKGSERLQIGKNPVSRPRWTKPTVLDRLGAALLEHGPMTATQVSVLLGVNRANVSHALSNSNAFVRLSQERQGVYYGLAS